MALDPIFVGGLRTEGANINTANLNRDGTGTVATLFTAGASGSKVITVNVRAQVATTAGMIRFFKYDGATYFLYYEIPVIATPLPGASTPGFTATFSPDLILESGWSLRVSTAIAEMFSVTATGGDY